MRYLSLKPTGVVSVFRPLDTSRIGDPRFPVHCKEIRHPRQGDPPILGVLLEKETSMNSALATRASSTHSHTDCAAQAAAICLRCAADQVCTGGL